MTVSPALSTRLGRREADRASPTSASSTTRTLRRPSTRDAVPLGNPYDLVGLGDKLYISDGNYNRIIEADPATGSSASSPSSCPGR